MGAREDQIDLLLDEYEQQKARGADVSLSDLCQECPELRNELAEQIRKLDAMNAMLGVADETLGRGEHAGDTLPAWDVAAAEPLPAGRYRPIEFHARGGLGEVFVAEDVELGRQVALKRMSGGQARLPQSCRRFEVEAMITGRLEHPGIVPIYGLGHDSAGRPVYAMRFVRGETLEAAIDRFHAQTASAVRVNRLGLQQLLQRFLAVCQTVAYAHDRGVVHRDVKPANIMLGDFGETLLVDWGLARAARDAARDDERDASEPVLPDLGMDATQMGVVKGSPSYMSPEQAAGRTDLVGPPSDVYSLGATLYRLLTGEPPFSGATHEVLVAVERGQLRPPREASADVPPPLEAVCLRAMQLLPEQRYASPLDLAKDVENWLADEPVSAWTEPWQVRCRRWLRRHRTLVSATAASAVVLLACLAVATLLLSRRNEQLVLAQRGTQAALEQTEQARSKAEQSLKTGLDAVRRMLTRVGNDELADVPEMETVRQRVLEDAVSFLEGFVGFEDSVSLQEEQGLALRYLGNVQLLLRRNSEAEESFRRAIELQEKLVATQPNSDQYRLELGVTWHELGRLLLLRDSLRAQSACETSLALIEPLLGRLPRCELTFSEVLNTSGILYGQAGESRQAEACYRRAVELREQLAASAPPADADRLHYDIARIYHNLGSLQQVHGRLDEARSSYEVAVRTWEQKPDDPLLWRRHQMGLQELYNSLGSMLADEGHAGESEEYHRKALAIREELARLYPAVAAYREGVARSHHNLGTLFQTTNRAQDALREYRISVDIGESLVKSFPDDVYLQRRLGESYVNLALLQHALQDTDQAEISFAHAQAALQQLVEHSPEVLENQVALGANEVNYGRFLREQGRLDESLQMHRQAIDRLQPIWQRDPQNRLVRSPLLNAHGAIANTLTSQRRYDEAAPHCDRVVELCEPDQRNQYRMWRIVTLARVDPLRALHEARDMSRIDNLGGVDFYNFACVCALALQTLRDADDADRGGEIEEDEYIAQACEFLEMAFDRDAFATEPIRQMLESDPDLHALRECEEFRGISRRVAEKYAAAPAEEE